MDLPDAAGSSGHARIVPDLTRHHIGFDHPLFRDAAHAILRRLLLRVGGDHAQSHVVVTGRHSLPEADAVLECHFGEHVLKPQRVRQDLVDDVLLPLAAGEQTHLAHVADLEHHWGQCALVGLFLV